MDEICDNSSEQLPENKGSLLVKSQQRSAVLYNIFFSLVVIVGLTGQGIAIPLWVDSGRHQSKNLTSPNGTHYTTYQPFMDEFFVSVFATFILAIIFGLCLAVRRLYAYITIGERFNRRISHKIAVLCGLNAGFNGILITFASSGTRTAPHLQAVMVNVTIPATLILRYCILKKSPTKRKLICALTTLFALFVCLLPSMVPKIDPNHNAEHKEQGGATGWTGIFWAFCYLFGFVLVSVGFILQEKLFQYQNFNSTTKVDVLYILFLIECFQFVAGASLFWIDAIPIFGSVDNIEKVFLNFYFGLQCSFGDAGCSFYPALNCSIFVLSVVCYMTGSAYLLRYFEGAALLAIVQAMATPLGFLFWTLFKEQPSFHWHPELSVTVWLNIVGLVVMVPSVYLYNAEGETQPKQEIDDKLEVSETSQPLLEESSSRAPGYI